MLLTSALRIALQVLAGVGLSELADKFIRPKVPAYYTENLSPGFRFPKLIWFVAIFVIAIIGLRYIGRKTKISILK
jgi:uncharacterized membrane protein